MKLGQFVLVLATLLSGACAPGQTRLEIPDGGWRVWLDPTADWQAEPAYLPGDVDLSRIPVRPPTGGWAVLEGPPKASKLVTLPTTVEQHFWGAAGFRSYTPGEYFYAGIDPVPQHGRVLGVSWWWRSVRVPRSFQGKRAVLTIRGAKQRAEVYVNRRLVGYSLLAELPFEGDVTSALRPGEENEIAVRLTNPGGRLDWGDWGTARLGDVSFYEGHGFGGLDRGITLTAHGPIRVRDAWVLNTPEPRTIRAYAKVENATDEPTRREVTFEVVNPRTSQRIVTATVPFDLPARGERTVERQLRVADARLWSPDQPELYQLRTTVRGDEDDVRETSFGFRWFGPVGVGRDAQLELNGERIRVYSAISWGFWGLNGLWPTPELAEKEVRVAKRLGLNSVNFHRNLPRPEVLDAADRIGLLRYAEPGGGSTLFFHAYESTGPVVLGIPARPASTHQRYLLAKLQAMVRLCRSHPSVTMYVVQNELNDGDLNHPIAEIALRTIHQEDPSRPAVLKSGLGPKGQLWMAPYDDTVYRDDGTGYSGWWDNHTVGTPDSWNDENYRGPTNHVYRDTNRREVVTYGEMGGSGAADDHALMVRQIRARGGASYDLRDHEEVAAAYERFLDRFGFRKAFPTARHVFRAVGAKQYEYWRHVMTVARLSDTTDYLTLSGWETTAVENHSGIVDNLRNPHGDPSVLAGALRPVMPVVQVRESLVKLGDRVTADLFFLNERPAPASGEIELSLRSPDGRRRSLGRFPLPAPEPRRFSVLIKEGILTPPLEREGRWELTARFGKLTESRTLEVVAAPRPRVSDVAVADVPLAADDLSVLGVAARAWDPSRPPAVTMLGAGGMGSAYRTDGTPTGTPDPDLYRVHRFGQEGQLAFRFRGLPNGTAKVTLGFAEGWFTSPGSRVFDVKVNGTVAIPNLDIFVRAGGKDRVWQTTVAATVTDGTLVVEPGRVSADNALFNTILIEADGVRRAVYFGEQPYTAKDGTVWQPYRPQVSLSSDLLARVREGMGLILMPSDDDSLRQFCEDLATAGAWKFRGLVGRSPAPWMGSWYFVRPHPLYAGLPTATVMKGDYQVSVGTSNGVLVDGPGVEVITAYSRDHARAIGAGDVVVPFGKGRILLHSVPRMTDPFQRRWLSNALDLVGSRTKK